MSGELPMDVLLDGMRVLEDRQFARVRKEHVEAARAVFSDHLRVLTQEKEVDKDRLRDAARSFDFYARLALKEARHEFTRTAVAEILGESRTGYADALAGRKCGVQRIVSWLARWDMTFPTLPSRVVVPPPVRPNVEHPVLSREWFSARGCPLPPPSYVTVSEYDADVERAKGAVTEAQRAHDASRREFRQAAHFLLRPAESLPARRADAAMRALAQAEENLRRVRQERVLFREEHRRIREMPGTPIVGSLPVPETEEAMHRFANDLVGCYKQIVYAPSLEFEFLVDTARYYDALARAILYREGKDARQRYIAYLVGERGAEYLSVVFGKIASREHLLRWWANWPLFTLDASGEVVFLPTPER